MSTLITLFKNLNYLQAFNPVFIPVYDLNNLKPHEMIIREEDSARLFPRQESTIQELINF